MATKEIQVRSGKSTRDTTTFARQFKVQIADGENTGVIAALNQLALDTGINGNSYYTLGGEFNTLAIVDNFDCKQDPERKDFYHVTVNYSTGAKPDQHPILDSPIRSFGQIPFSYPWDYDRHGSLMVNSAGDLFTLQPYEKEINHRVLKIVRNELTFPLEIDAAYENAVNSDSFYGQPRYTWKCLPITGQQVDGGKWGFYWTVTYQFEFAKEGWQFRPLDQGLRELTEDGSNQQHILINGAQAEEQVKLDGSGHVLGNGETPFFHNYEPLDTLPFSSVFSFV